MAQITVIYKDFDEMVAVARELLKSMGEIPATLESSAEQQETPVAYGRQIAPHFPNANEGGVLRPIRPRLHRVRRCLYRHKRRICSLQLLRPVSIPIRWMSWHERQ